MSWFRKLLGRQPAEAGVSVSDRVPVATVQLPPPEGPVSLYQDQILRKQWSEDVVAAQGVAINRHLPCIEGEYETQLRTADEVAGRLLALALVAVKGEGLEQDLVEAIVAERDARRLFTPREVAFIDDPDPSQHDRIQFSWRYEAAWTLLWALNLIEPMLGPPNAACDPARLVAIVRDTDDLAAHGLQSANNILNEADLIYRYHWAVRQNSIDGTAAIGDLHSGVVMERHHALNWLIGYSERADWDDVTTDT